MGSHDLLLDTIPPPIIPCTQLNKKFTKQCEKGITLTHPLQTLMKAYRTRTKHVVYAVCCHTQCNYHWYLSTVQQLHNESNF